jgi:hypothetical protein
MGCIGVSSSRCYLTAYRFLRSLRLVLSSVEEVSSSQPEVERARDVGTLTSGSKKNPVAEANNAQKPEKRAGRR